MEFRPRGPLSSSDVSNLRRHQANAFQLTGNVARNVRKVFGFLTFSLSETPLGFHLNPPTPTTTTKTTSNFEFAAFPSSPKRSGLTGEDFLKKKGRTVCTKVVLLPVSVHGVSLSQSLQPSPCRPDGNPTAAQDMGPFVPSPPPPPSHPPTP